jgi:hypothetical protein
MVALQFVNDVFGLCRRGTDGIDHALGLARGVEMHQRHLHRLTIRIESPIQLPSVSGGFGQAPPALAPQNAGQLLDQMLLCRSLRPVLGHQHRDQGAVFVRILPGKHGVAR